MLDAVQKAGIKHMVATTALCPSGRSQAIDVAPWGASTTSAAYLQEWIMPHYNADDPRLQKSKRAAPGDLGAHHRPGPLSSGRRQGVSAMADYIEDA